MKMVDVTSDTIEMPTLKLTILNRSHPLPRQNGAFATSSKFLNLPFNDLGKKKRENI